MLGAKISVFPESAKKNASFLHAEQKIPERK
jgi:hypothetical protein